jgi:RNA polymerase sigma-70 factor (ECF subfamily)
VSLALVEQARSGDEAAFARLARKAGDELLAIAYRILRDVDTAEDAVQQTIVTAWRELPSLRDADRFDAWLHRILVNACYREARKARRWGGMVKALPLGLGANDDAIGLIDVRDQLEHAFRHLTPEERAVLVFRYYLGLTLPEVAARLGVPIGTVKSRLHYASRALRAAIEADLRPSFAPQERVA